MKNLNQVHLNGLRAIEAVGRLGSLQAAADELGVTIGAVSQQVIRAEAQLGRPVFDRLGKGMVANEIGIVFVASLTEAFRKLSDAVGQATRRESDILTISVAPVFASRWLMHRIDRFAEQFPDIRLRMDATTRLVDMTASDVDIAIRVGAGNWGDVESELLLAQQVFPVCSPSFAERLKTATDILDCPVVVDEKAMFGWDVWLDAAGIEDRDVTIRHRFSEASICLDAAVAGQGLMLAWQTLAADAIADGRLVVPFPIRAKTGFGHYFVSAVGAKESPHVRAFKSWIRRELAESMNALGLRFAKNQEPAL
jgi:DNA-binding transcriptional LysR family regulator